MRSTEVLAQVHPTPTKRFRCLQNGSNDCPLIRIAAAIGTRSAKGAAFDGYLLVNGEHWSAQRATLPG